MGLLDKVLGTRASAVKIGGEVRALVESLVSGAGSAGNDPDSDANASAQAILSLDPLAQIQALHACFQVLNAREGGLRAFPVGIRYRAVDWRARERLSGVSKRLLQRKLPYSRSGIVALVDACSGRNAYIPVRSVVSVVERQLAGEGPDEELTQSLKRLRSSLSGRLGGAGMRKQGERISRLLGGSEAPDFELKALDAWSTAMRSVLADMSSETADSWCSLLAHCNTATAARPSKKWLAEAQRRLEAVTDASVASTISTVLEATGKPGPGSVKVYLSWLPSGFAQGDPSLVSEHTSDCLRGLVWTSSLVDDERLIELIGEAAERCFRKVPGHGPLSPKIGNACLYVLSEDGTDRAAAELTRLKTRVKHAPADGEGIGERGGAIRTFPVEARRDGGAELWAGCGWKADPAGRGLRRDARGRRAAQCERDLAQTRRQDAEVSPAGGQVTVPRSRAGVESDGRRAQKSAPTAGEPHRAHAALAAVDAVRGVDGRYLDHPLTGYLARRLIWVFEDGDEITLGAWCDGAITDAEGRKISPSPSSVRLWHPMESDAEMVRKWRSWLGAHSVTQPSKQALSPECLR